MPEPHLVEIPAGNSDLDASRGKAPRWLLPVVPIDARVSATDDCYISEAALAARDGDRGARDALFAAFAPRLRLVALRIARRLSLVPSRVVEPADAIQESYLVFVNMIERWNGGDSFTAYVAAVFPHRLRDAMRHTLPAHPVADEPMDWLADGSHDAEEARVLLETLAAGLPASEAVVLLAHVRDGESLTAIARQLGLSRRTVQRRWSRVLARLRRSFELDSR